LRCFVGAAVIRGLAVQNGFSYVDMYSPFEDYYRAHGLKGLADLYVEPLDGHPNAEGHRLIAEALEPAVESALRERLPPARIGALVVSRVRPASGGRSACRHGKRSLAADRPS